MTQTMTRKDSDLKRLMDDLATTRDELRVKAHLAKADLRDELDDLEDRYQKLKTRVARAGDEASEASDDVATATRLLGEELKRGYDRVRDALAA